MSTTVATVTTLRLRHHAHRGSVLAAGFAIDVALVGDHEARRRVLALWRPGARVHEHGGALLVTGLPIHRVRAQLAPGAPIVAQHGVLAAMPLDADEAAALAAPGAVVISRDGAAEVVALAAARAVDVTAWIDLADFAIAEVAPLAAPPAAVAVPPPPVSDVRSLIGVAAAPVDMAKVATALARVRSGAPAVAGSPSLWRRMLRWLADRLAPRAAGPGVDDVGGVGDGGVGDGVGGVGGVGGSVGDGAAAGSVGDVGDGAAAGGVAGAAGAGAAGTADRLPAPQIAAPSWLDRLRSRIAAAAWRSRLGELLGRQHAAYLRRLLELFDRGELDEALRRAVPLGGDGGPAARIGVGLPRPRDDLRLSFAPRRGGSAIPIGDAALAMVRERYRAAAERLERADRIDEAAFVLAELLADVEAAIALLERHGRHALAARLAEARGLPPGLVVRLWFLAGDRPRAIACARRHQAWADAVARLERADDKRAVGLRLLWADHLADTGDFVQAVEVLWPLRGATGLVDAWIDRGIAAAGAAGARLLIKKLVLSPVSLGSVAQAILAVLDDRDTEAPRWRLALFRELVAAPPSPELRTIARPALRALLRDAAAGAAPDTAELRSRLIALADDAALRADLPALPAARTTQVASSAPLSLRWPASDTGLVAVHDAAALPGARFAVALGELGVRVLGRDERVIAHIDQPAARLVISDHGTLALAIAPRGQVQRLARLDLVGRRGAYWCDVEIDSCARSFDGDLWIVARGRTVAAIDTLGPRWQSVWGVDIDPRGATCAVGREGKWFAVEAFTPAEGELWYYEGFTLRRRRSDPPMDPPFGPPFAPSLGPPFGSPVIRARPGSQDWIAVAPGVLRGPDWRIEIDDAPVIAVEVAGDAAVIGQRGAAGVVVTAVHLAARRPLAWLWLDGAAAVSLRLAGWLLTLADDRGRLIAIDLERGVLRRDLRVA